MSEISQDIMNDVIKISFKENVIRCLVEDACSYHEASVVIRFMEEVLIEQYSRIESINQTLKYDFKESTNKFIIKLLDFLIKSYKGIIELSLKLILEDPEYHLGGRSLKDFNKHIR